MSGWRVGVREVLLTQGWQVVGKEGGRVPVASGRVVGGQRRFEEQGGEMYGETDDEMGSCSEYDGCGSSRVDDG